MKVQTLVACHERVFESFGGVPKRVLYDNMKTVVLERDSHGEGQHRYHAGFLDYAKHCGFVIKLCRPYRAKTKGKVERFNGYLRRSFYVPLASRLKQAGLKLDVVTANIEVACWLEKIANERMHGTTGVQPSARLRQERLCLQSLPGPWRGDMAAARAQAPIKTACSSLDLVQPDAVAQHMAQVEPMQHPLAVYEQLLIEITQGAAA